MRGIIVVCISLILMACGAVVDVVTLDETARAKTTKIDVFTSYASIDHEYKEIAVLSANDQGWGRKESELIEKLKEKAMKLGANGIVLVGLKESHAGSVPIGDSWFNINERIVRVVAIIYTD